MISKKKKGHLDQDCSIYALLFCDEIVQNFDAKLPKKYEIAQNFDAKLPEKYEIARNLDARSTPYNQARGLVALPTPTSYVTQCMSSTGLEVGR